MSKLSDFLGGGFGSGGGGTLPTRVVSSNETVESNFNVGIDTSDGPVTITLPPDPEPGDRLMFFDAALTWDTNHAILNKNGYPLGIDNPELQEVKLTDRGGVLEFLFANETLGWIDVAFYKEGTNPKWFGAFIESRPVYSIIGDDTPPRISNITSSTDWEVPQTGYYGINISGGGGAAATPPNGTPGGDSVFSVDGVNLITTKGGRAATLTYQPSEIDQNAVLSFPLDLYSVPVHSDIALFKEGYVAEGVEFSYPLNELSVYGIDLFTISGSYWTASGSGTPYYGYPVRSKAFILFLEEGSQVSVNIGAGGTGLGNARSGRCEIYDLNGSIV